MPRIFLPEEILRARFFDRAVQDLRAFGKFAADVDVGDVHVERETGDHHPLDQLMRILVNDVAVLERARLGFVGVADQVDRLFLVGLDEAPLHAAGETRAAAAAQAGILDLVHDLGAAHLDRGLELLVAAVLQVAIDVVRVAFAPDVFENQPALERMGRGVTTVRRSAELCESSNRGTVALVRLDVFVQFVIHHADRRGAATGKAFDELDAVFAVRD